jgi:hypothetical protein
MIVPSFIATSKLEIEAVRQLFLIYTGEYSQSTQKAT